MKRVRRPRGFFTAFLQEVRSIEAPGLLVCAIEQRDVDTVRARLVDMHRDEGIHCFYRVCDGKIFVVRVK